MMIGAYTEAPSAIGTGNANLARIDKEGAQYIRPASGIISYSSASVETHSAGSALLHDLHIGFFDANVGDTVVLEDGDNHRLTFYATAASYHISEHYSTGLVFNTTLKHTLTFGGAGAASVSLAINSQY